MPSIAWVNDLALFLHVVAAAALTAGGVVQVTAGARVRAASTGTELASWARFARGAGPVTIVAATLSLLTGGHLAGAAWGFEFPFVTLGTLGLVLLAPVGPMLGGARLRRLAAAADEVGSSVIGDDLGAAARDPLLWGPVHSLVGISIGLIYLMTTKPGWVGGVVALAATFVIGWMVGVVVARGGAPAVEASVAG